MSAWLHPWAVLLVNSVNGQQSAAPVSGAVPVGRSPLAVHALLPRPENPVSRTPEPGEDVTHRVELAIERRREDRNGGVGGQHGLDTLRSGDQAQKPDPRA